MRMKFALIAVVLVACGPAASSVDAGPDANTITLANDAMMPFSCESHCAPGCDGVADLAAAECHGLFHGVRDEQCAACVSSCVSFDDESVVTAGAVCAGIQAECGANAFPRCSAP